MEKHELSMNPSLLSLLEVGASLTLPNGVVLIGNPKEGCIEIAIQSLNGVYGNQGVRHLSESGLEEALDDANRMEKGRRHFACRTPDNSTKGVPFFK